LTITAGQTASFTITATALNGFNSSIANFACSGEPAGTTCHFSKSMLSPVGGTADSLTVTLATNSNPYNPRYGVMNGMGMWLPMTGIGLFGIVIAESRRRKKLRRRVWWHWLAYAFTIAVFSATLLSVSGCGGYGSGSGTNGTPRGTTTMMITATSGSITHSTNVTLTVQ
jgi:hypothetical protein